MRLKLFLLILAVGLMAFAAQKTYVFVTNRQPTRITCAEFVGNNSNAKWVELTDCELDLKNAFGLESRVLKIEKGSYVPVRAIGAKGPAPILLKVNDDDPGLGIAPQQESSPAGDTTPAALPRLVATVSGLIQSGFDSDRKTERALDKLARDGKVRSDYRVIEAGKKPDPADAVVGVAVLLGVPAIAYMIIRNARRESVAAAGPTPPPLPPVPPGSTPGE
jgi:hypothetical protein